MFEHGSVIRPTMYLACMDIKTAFDVEDRSTLHELWRITMSMDGLCGPLT